MGSEVEACSTLEVLSKAADRCDVDALRELLSAGVDVDHTSPQCRLTALQIVCSASTNGHDDHRVACAALLLAHGASPNAGTPGGPAQNFTPLMHAALKTVRAVARNSRSQTRHPLEQKSSIIYHYLSFS